MGFILLFTFCAVHRGHSWCKFLITTQLLLLVCSICSSPFFPVVTVAHMLVYFFILFVLNKYSEFPPLLSPGLESKQLFPWRLWLIWTGAAFCVFFLTLVCVSVLSSSQSWKIRSWDLTEIRFSNPPLAHWVCSSWSHQV